MTSTPKLQPGFVRLARSEHPYARAEFDEGRLELDKPIANLSMFFKLSPAQKKDRDALAAAQLDPASPSYHKWLTPETYAARFGAQPADIARAKEWLAKQGFEVHGSSRLGTRVTFSGTVAQLEAAFQTEMHRYNVGGESHYAMATAPALPTDLASIVLGLHNTHDFYPRPSSQRLNANAYQRRGTVVPHYKFNAGAGIGEILALGPSDWAAAYDVTSLYTTGINGQVIDGTGVNVGIVGTAEIAASDVAAFRSKFDLPVRPIVTTLVPNTGAATAGRRGGGLEAILDTEWSGAIARGATIQYVFVGANDHNVDDAVFYMIEENIAPVMSESYGGCEADSLPTDADILEANGTAANILGITYMASAGDSGAADCINEGVSGLYVDMPGSYPGVTSVGGTEFSTLAWTSDGTLTGYPASEQAWNESNDVYSQEGIGAGGGGISGVFARPAYQRNVTTCTPVGTVPTPSTTPMRMVPDVALAAASTLPGYYVECTFNSTSEDCSTTGGSPQGTPIGGTSAASPSFAGMVALLNQATGERLGNINPVLYQLQAQASTTGSFHDIVAGNNEIVCAADAADAGEPPDGDTWPTDVGCGPDGLYGYAATAGYDCASGLGSIDGVNLVRAWLAEARTTTSLVPSPDQTTEGAKVTLSATIAVPTPNSDDVTGNVTFSFQSYAANGANDLSWELGTVDVASATTMGAQATLSTAIPPGLVKPGNQSVDVIAIYNGDTNHLPSSARASVSFGAISFAVEPSTLTLPVNGTKTFKTTGGVTPVSWFIVSDTTRSMTKGSFGAASIDEVGGYLTAGPNAGYVVIRAIDHDGAEATAEITVGSPTTTPPWDIDAGIVYGPPDASADAAVNDADDLEEAGTTTAASSSKSGCSCELAESSRTSPLGIVGAIAGLVVVGRRRRRRS